MNFSKQKRFTLSVLLFAVCSAVVFSQGFQKEKVSELDIFNEANSAFYSGFYPGAVEKADSLIENYPESVFIISASVMKGEALVYLGRYNQAAEVLTKIIPSIHLGDENYERAFFFLGKALFYSQDYTDAVKAFYECCKASVSQSQYKYYDMSMLFAARSLFVIKDYDKAVPVMEYCLSQKQNFTKDDYNEIFQKLMISYNNVSQFQKNIDLYNSISRSDFTDEIYYRIMLQTAFSYEGLEDNEIAYKFYCGIIQAGIKDLAVISLKRAYLITTKNPSVDSSELFEITKKAFGTTSLVSEFWVRLGIDSYVENDYTSAENYFNSAKENNPAEFACVINLYEQKIKLQQFVPEKSDRNDLAIIQQNLESLEKAVSQSSFEKINDVYYSALIQCYSLENNWEKIPAAYEKLEEKDNQNLYCYALSLFNSKKYSAVEELLQNKTEIRFLNIYAKTAVAAEDYKKAESTYEKLIGKLEHGTSVSENKTVLENLPPETTLESIKNEYCKVLYKLGEYENCLMHCKEILQFNDAKYLSGLCCVKLQRWPDSITYFEDYIKASKNNKNQFYFTSLYYTGYANYVTGVFERAYLYFAKYNDESSNETTTDVKKIYSANAFELAAKSALQLRRYAQAAAQGEKLIQSLDEVSEKQSAVLFTAEIYVDAGNYKSAIALLKPWTTENSDFAAECILKTAEIYQKSGNLNQAEELYENLVTNFGKTVLAEESLFDCGEMFYSAGNYEKAEDKFSRYIYKYVEGKFAENALFFSADCNFNLKKYERSIMLNNRLCKKYPKSTYLYSAYKNLLEANYLLENYSDALYAANYLMEHFELQAKNDGIQRRIVELQKIIAGLDTSAAKKYSEFEQKGGIKTVEGRHAGTALVQLYVNDDSTKNDGIILALQLLPLEQGNLEDEVADAAKNASLIADWYRSKGSTKDAADYYLLAAEYYRSSGELDEQKPASALYSAVESFVAEGMMGDARETASLLKSLYADSKYASAVDRLIR